MLQAQCLSFQYHFKPILREVSLEVAPGKVLSILGPNGVGKTTLIRCLLNILKPTQGTVLMDGRNIAAMQALERAKHLAYVPQAGGGHFPMTTFEMVLMGRRPHLSWRPTPRDIDAVGRVIRLLDLDQEALTEYDRLSGGQKQKVMLAKAMAQEARYLLLDEPTNHLDLKHQLDVMDIVARMSRQEGIGVIMAIHDINLALRVSDEVLILTDGSVSASGHPDIVLTEANIEKAYGVSVRKMGLHEGKTFFYAERISQG